MITTFVFDVHLKMALDLIFEFRSFVNSVPAYSIAAARRASSGVMPNRRLDVGMLDAPDKVGDKVADKVGMEETVILTPIG